MKRSISLVMLAMVSLTSFAQIEMRETANWILIGELKFGGISKAKLQYIHSGGDTTYMLFIKDVREQPKNHYFGINFKGIDNTFNTLYDILKACFLKENRKNRKYEKTFKLGDSFVHLQHYRLITAPGIMFSTKEGHAYFTEKDIDKLFGKRE